MPNKTPTNPARSPHQANPWAGKIFLCLIGLMCVFAGGIFEWLMIRSYQNAQATRTWDQVESTIIVSEIEKKQISGSPEEYKLELVFSYKVDGNEQRSNKLSIRGNKWTKELENVEKLQEKYPKGSNHTAYVNPDDPKVAILLHDTKAAGYSLWFPALIILGGGGMIWGALRKRD